MRRQLHLLVTPGFLAGEVISGIAAEQIDKSGQK
jgi:hypothetical protein